MSTDGVHTKLTCSKWSEAKEGRDAGRQPELVKAVGNVLAGEKDVIPGFGGADLFRPTVSPRMDATAFSAFFFLAGAIGSDATAMGAGMMGGIPDSLLGTRLWPIFSILRMEMFLLKPTFFENIKLRLRELSLFIAEINPFVLRSGLLLTVWF